LRSTDTTAGHGRFPGWTVVAASFIILATTSGLGFYGLAVFVSAFADERGWEVSSISFATTLFFLVSGLFGVIVSKIIAKRDLRPVIVTGGVIGALAIAGLAKVTEKWHLYLLYVIWAIGWACAGMVPATTVITRWFHVKRSVALSVASTGLSLGGVLLTPVMKRMLDEYGIADTAPWLALIWFVGIVPVTVLMMKPDPIPLGWLPDGIRVSRERPRVEPIGIAYVEARGMWFYWAITIGYVFMMGAQVGGILQLVKLMQERAGQSAATLVTSVLAGTSVVARLIGGRVAARVPMGRLTTVLGYAQASSLLLLALLQHTVPLFAAVVLFGATVGTLLMLQPLLIAERFGVREYADIYSRSSFISMFGTACSPWLLGLLHDHGGGYRTSYLVAAGMSAVGATFVASGGSASYREFEPTAVARTRRGATVAAS
jgi:MFS family permease